MFSEFKLAPSFYADAGFHLYPSPEEYDTAFGIDAILSNLRHLLQIKDSNRYAGRLVTT